MIEIKGLCHSFGNNKVLEDVNLTVKDSCVLGLIGINGAGKSTLLRSISGVYKPLKGSVEYDGKSPASEKTRQDIFLLPDDPYFGMQTNCRSLIKMYKVFYPYIHPAKNIGGNAPMVIHIKPASTIDTTPKQDVHIVVTKKSSLDITTLERLILN